MSERDDEFLPEDTSELIREVWALADALCDAYYTRGIRGELADSLIAGFFWLVDAALAIEDAAQ